MAWRAGSVKGVELDASSLIGLGPGKARCLCSVDGRCRLLRLCAKRRCQYPGKGAWPPPRIFSYHAETIGDDRMNAVAREAPATPLLAFRHRCSKRAAWDSWPEERLPLPAEPRNHLYPLAAGLLEPVPLERADTADLHIVEGLEEVQVLNHGGGDVAPHALR